MDENNAFEGVQYRSAQIEATPKIDAEARTVELAFSSENPVERSFGNEVLSHDEGAADLSRLNDGAPLLLEHDRGQQIGVVERAWVDDDRKGRATVRFSKSALGQEIFQDVQDGIRRLVSVGYSVSRFVSEKAEAGLDTLRAVDWQPLEVSLVSIPADNTVGVGRASEETATHQQTKNMEENTQNTVEESRESVRIEVRPDKRAEEIAALGKRFDAGDEAVAYIAEGKSADDFKDFLMNRQQKAEPIVETQRDLGMDKKEVEQYSLVRAIKSSVDGSLGGIELEASQELEKRFGRPAQGFFVPNDVLNFKRDLTATGAGDTGDKLVSTVNGDYIPALNAEPLVVQLGARVLSGLRSNVNLPRGGKATAYWVDENGAPTESTMTIGQLALTPKRIAGYSELSKQLIAQSDYSVEQIVRDDLNLQLAIAIDQAAIQGSGSGNEPEGITNNSDVNSVTSTGSGAHTLEDVVECEAAVATDNALMGSLAYAMTPAVKASLKTTSVDSGSGRFIMEGADLNGYRAEASTQVPASNLVFGDFSQLIVAEFGSGADVVIDPFSLATTGMVRVTVSRLADIGLRHPEAFAVCAA